MTATAQLPATSRLSEHALREFLYKAGLIGHNKQDLLNGEEIMTYFQLHDFSTAREVLSNATAEQHARRLKTFFSPAHLSRTKLGQGKHDRGEAVVFANAPIPEQDAKGINRHFPVCLKGISVLHKVVAKDEIWDVTLPQEIFNLGEMEELYSIVNIGTLILEEGAKIVIRGNVFSMLCQQLICKGAPTSLTDYHIGILPTPFSVDFGHGPMNGVNGSHGSGGANGLNGIPGEWRTSLLGLWLPEQSTEKMHGSDAQHAENGKDGGKGRNGGMCKLAEITIRQLQGRLQVFSQAGDGGDGGNGGNGGIGRNGGNGVPGLKGFNQQIPGGNAGHGGNGGNGGKGGNAGNGGLASNIYLNIPKDTVDNVCMTSLNSVGGMGGTGGKAGQGGKAGTVAEAPEPALSGRAGKDGLEGKPGKNGHHGRPRPAAVLYLNDLPYQKNNS